MAEVINQQGTGVDFSGLQRTPSPEPTTGSAGRTEPQGIDFSGLADIAQSAAEGISGIATRQEEQEQAAALGDAVAAQQNLVDEFVSGGSVEALAKGAYAGTGYDEDQVVALKEYGGFVNKLEQAKQAGKPELALELALTRHRRNMLSRHPELSKEFLQMSGKIETLNEEAVSQVTREKEARQAAYEDVLGKATGALEARGISTQEMTDDEVISRFQDEVGDAQQQEDRLARRAKNIKNKQDISDYQKRQEIDKLLQNGGVDNQLNMLSNDLLNVAGSGASAEEKAIEMRNLIRERKTKIMQQTGITQDSRFKSFFGDRFDNITQLAEGVADGSISEEQATNQLNTLQAVTKAGVYKKYEDVQEVGVLLDALEPIFSIQGLNPNITEQLTKTASNALRNYNQSLSGEDTEDDGQDGNPAQIGNTSPWNTEEGDDEDRTAQDVEQRGQEVAELVRRGRAAGYSNDRNGTVAQKTGVSMAVSMLNDSTARNTYAGVKEVAPVLADPRTVDEIGDSQVPDRAVNMAGDYIRSLVSSGGGLLVENSEMIEGAEYTDNGLLSLSLRESDSGVRGQRGGASNVHKLRRFESKLNEAIQMWSHLQGDKGDYKGRTRDILRRIVEDYSG